MSFIDWNDSFLTGITQFDNHHKHLVALLNQTYDDFIDNELENSMEEILAELVEYAAYHFAAEEQWLAKHNYPGFKRHQQEHEYFAERITALQKDFLTGKVKISMEMLSFLKSWLSVHILGSDADYGDFTYQTTEKQ